MGRVCEVVGVGDGREGSAREGAGLGHDSYSTVTELLLLLNCY